MKKKNLNNLNLKKETISKLSSETIVGGNEIVNARSYPFYYNTCVSCPITSVNVDCNWSQHKTGDTPPQIG